jgi:hypothetical protein
MSQAFPAPYIYPIDRASQNKTLQQAGWGGMATYGTVPSNTLQSLSTTRQTGGRGTINNYVGTFQPPTPTMPPVRYYPNTAYGINNTGVTGTNMVTQPMAAMDAVMPSNTNSVGLLGSPQANISYAPDMGGFNLPNYIREVGPSGLPAVGGTDSNWFSNLLGKGKETWNENKDWLVGDKNNIGLAPLGLGLFNAFNQYTLGKESIKSMREQNALARESFALNKEGLKTELEDKLLKRNLNQNYYVNGDKQSYADNLTSANTKTKEEMKRFK